MKCPKCQEIDHPHGARYCHACGEPLMLNAANRLIRHLRWGNSDSRPPEPDRNAKMPPQKTGTSHSIPFLHDVSTLTGRFLKNKSPQWLYEKICQTLGKRPGRWLTGISWSQATRYLLLAAIIIENLILSVIEYHLHEPWGQVTIFLVNMSTILLTACTCISANIYDMYENRSGGWRMYYNWLHFLMAAAIPFAGYMTTCAFHNFLILVTDYILSGTLLLMDSGTIEALTDDR